ncbi:SLC13 family permease [Zophobihabitans entericus]|uniref:SLC13 family permease n=1 Tax=Zophobihabitans entericus TaxID=1635327 RepID=A0A6G9IEW5_9GAMM|nr:SLC13 family permease [Zophobihabitans entericus]
MVTHGQLMIVCLLLLIAIILFSFSKLRMDIIALLIIVAITITGILTPAEALAGFSDPNIVLIALLFVVGEGLVRTGISYQMSDYILKVAGNNDIRIIVLIMLGVALLGSIMSSTGVVAIFIPVVISIASRTGLHVKKLMMPLCIAGLISGMMTLVATAPNLVVNSELERASLKEFGFFSITPIGLSILVIGIIYSVISRNWLIRSLPTSPDSDHKSRRKMIDLIRDYKLSGRAHRAAIKPDSPFIGRTIDSLHLRSQFGANVIGIERWRKFRKVMIPVTGATVFRENDVLLFDMLNSEENLRQFLITNALEPKVLRGEYFSEQAKEVGMAEVALLPDSALLNKTVKEIEFRTKYFLSVIGIRRNHEAIESSLVDEKLEMGDILLVCGDWRSIQQMQSRANDFVLLDLPTEIDDVAPASSQAIPALLCLALMIMLMVSGIVPNVIAALIACLLMGATRCIDMTSAYRSIHWPSLILIIGMMPFAIALNKTGGIAIVSDWLKTHLSIYGPHVVLMFIFLLCSTVGLFLSNTATAILVAPIAINIALDFGYSPYPFAMTVAIATSASFITPVSSPVKTMIVAPGGYTFGDFVKIGIPLTFLVMAADILLVPVFFPF